MDYFTKSCALALIGGQLSGCATPGSQLDSVFRETVPKAPVAMGDFHGPVRASSPQPRVSAPGGVAFIGYSGERSSWLEVAPRGD